MSSLPPEAHRKLHLKPSIVKYKPVSVRKLLHDIWSYTNIAIDLAFYAFFAKDRELALKIIDLDKKISEDIAQFVLHNSMAYGRSRVGAYAGLLSFFYGSAMDAISDSVKDIVYAMLVGYAPSLGYEHLLLYADGEIVGKFTADEDFKLIDLTDRYPVDVVLTIENGNYIFNPTPEHVVKKGSTVYIRGFREVVLRLLSDKGVDYKLEDVKLPGLEGVIKSLTDIKDYTILMLDLAHYVLMELSKELLEEIEDLEVYIDWAHLETIRQLKHASNEIDPETFIGLVSLLKELEDIADASLTISRIPSLEKEFPEEYKEIFKHIFESIAEKVKTFTVTRNVSLAELEHYLRKYGGHTLAVRTKEEWIAYPLARNITLTPSDKLIVAYQVEFAEEVERLLANKI